MGGYTPGYTMVGIHPCTHPGYTMVGIVHPWVYHYLHTLGIPYPPTIPGTRAATWSTRLRAGRRGPGLKLEINNGKEASVRLRVSFPVTVVRRMVRRVFAFSRVKSMKDWIANG